MSSCRGPVLYIHVVYPPASCTGLVITVALFSCYSSCVLVYNNNNNNMVIVWEVYLSRKGVCYCLQMKYSFTSCLYEMEERLTKQASCRIVIVHCLVKTIRYYSLLLFSPWCPLANFRETLTFSPFFTIIYLFISYWLY